MEDLLVVEFLLEAEAETDKICSFSRGLIIFLTLLHRLTAEELRLLLNSWLGSPFCGEPLAELSRVISSDFRPVAGPVKCSSLHIQLFYSINPSAPSTILEIINYLTFLNSFLSPIKLFDK